MKRMLVVLAGALLLGNDVAAQEYDLDALPADVEARVHAELSDPASIRLDGPADVPADSLIRADVLVRGGGLRLGGTVDGDLIVLGGDLVLLSGAAVTGDVIVVGGTVSGAESATLGGGVIAYSAADPDVFDARADGRDDDRPRRRRGRRAGRGHGGGLDLEIGLSSNYNRVEGLPLMVGPQIRTAGPNPTQLEALAIWRTSPSESLEDEIGYRVRVEQNLWRGRVRLGAGAHDMVTPIEERGLNSWEAGLATVLFHADPHDYLHREGWAAWLGWDAPLARMSGRVEYRDEEHHELVTADPWSLFDNDDAWRRQPLVALGDLSSISADVTFDTRDDEDEPTRGWLVSAGALHPLQMDVRLPRLVVVADGIPLPIAPYGPTGFTEATVAELDVRRYTLVNDNATLNLRVRARGAIQDEVLPPQLQSALGGLGTLPGYELFEGDCGSRSPVVMRTEPDIARQAMHPGYGCDRTLLAQLEYRGGLHLGWDHDERDHDEDDGDWDGEDRDGDDRDGDDRDGDDRRDDRDWEDWDFDLHADWVLFADAGWGWSNGDVSATQRSDTDAMYDVGLGVLFGSAGVYGAVPLTGDDRSLRILLRLERRF